MTHSIDAPLPPPTTSGATTGTGSPSTTSPSTTDIAKGEAKNVGQSAAQAGSQVASTAADQAKHVAHETQRQAQDLLQQGRQQLTSQATAQQQKSAQGLSTLASQLRGMADGTSDGAPGPARDLLHQASGKLEDFGSWLESREPADLLQEVRSFARRKPGMFLLGAAGAGVLLGRLTSGVKAAHTDSSGTGSSGQRGISGSAYGQANYADSTSYSGHGQTGGYTESYSETTQTGTPLPPPPYGSVPSAGSVVPPTTPAGWDDPSRRTGGVS